MKAIFSTVFFLLSVMGSFAQLKSCMVAGALLLYAIGFRTESSVKEQLR